MRLVSKKLVSASTHEKESLAQKRMHSESPAAGPAQQQEGLAQKKMHSESPEDLLIALTHEINSTPRFTQSEARAIFLRIHTLPVAEEAKNTLYQSVMSKTDY